MRIDELKSALLDIISEYFQNAMVVWEGQRKSVRTGKNCVTLALRNMESTYHYIRVADEEDYTDYQPSMVRLTVQLFSHGETVKGTDAEGNSYSYSANTAVNDLAELEHFLTSNYGLSLLDKYDISIEKVGALNDASAILDTNYEYRAIQEYEVYFTQHIKGRAGVSEGQRVPTPSGGGTAELKDMEIGDIEKVDDIEKHFE